eukprot:scaffold3438_cov64-Attheya_sp.AAC.1
MKHKQISYSSAKDVLSRQELTWKGEKDQCFYCIEARDNEDDRTMTIKDLRFNLPPMQETTQHKAHYTLNGSTARV